MATPNPMEQKHNRHDYGHEKVSAKEYHIAGILTTVYGLEELSDEVRDVACLWLMHPRLQKHAIMAPVAAAAIHDWNKKSRESHTAGSQRKGLIAVSFDQRNHGTREVSKLANESWKVGNPAHAIDMFSIFHGTAQDTSTLIDFLPSYIFPTGQHTLTQNIALGVSLGGHSTWHCLLQEPRITAGVVVIGCPDYTRLMTDRARKTKLESWTSSEGRDFLGSKDYPKSLVEAVKKYDPAGLLLRELDPVDAEDRPHEPNEQEQKRIKPIMRETLGGKRIMCLFGGVDKLVPHKESKPFLKWFKHAIKKGAWAGDLGITLEDIVDEEAGHEYSPKMQVEAIKFISETLAGEGRKTGSKTSKI